MIHFTSPAGWLPVHRDQLQAQRLVTSMGKLYLLLLLLVIQRYIHNAVFTIDCMHITTHELYHGLLGNTVYWVKCWHFQAGDRSLAFVVAHEITHSWLGNLVTNSNWEHFWFVLQHILCRTCWIVKCLFLISILYRLSFIVGFYRAMLCIRGTSHGPVSVRLSVSVCLSVSLSQVGVLLKRLNIGSHKQHHTIAQGL